MKRYYFIDRSLDDLRSIEQELELGGVDPCQMHVLSQDDAGVSLHGLNEVHTFLKKDIVHAGERGALIGLAISAISIVVAYLSGLPETIGWVPFVFLSIILLGFFTWEGGFLGIQVPNSRFRRFEKALRRGRHVFFVDIRPDQEATLKRVIASHPYLRAAGTGSAAPGWIISSQRNWRHFLRWAP